jgi:gamma-glutamylputrescine oxidase
MNISFWEKNFTSRADMIILGNGIVGLQCAIHLKKKYPKRRIWVLDRAPFSLGASMRNAGFACFGSMGEILDDAARTSWDSAIDLYARRFEGLRLLLEDFGETNIGYEKTGGYEVFTANKNGDMKAAVSAMDQVNEQLQPITGQSTFVPKPSAALGMNVLETAIYTPVEGALQTNLLYDRIQLAARETGVEVYTGVHITALEEANAHNWVLRSAEGYQFHCKRLVVCTNGFAQQLLPDIQVEPARGQVMVTSHIPDLKWRGLVHADKGYYYFRSLGTRILIGGARNMAFEQENTDAIEINETIQAELLRFLREVVVPGSEFEITDRWAGIMGMAEDRSPIVQEWKPGLFVCVRMGGMGVALSASVSRQLAGLVEGL